VIQTELKPPRSPLKYQPWWVSTLRTLKTRAGAGTIN